MNPLASRKKLLIAESELNRAQLIQDWRKMAADVHALTNRAAVIRCFASATLSLAAGLASLRRKKSVPGVEKPSWLQTILKGAGAVSSFCSAFRTRPKS